MQPDPHNSTDCDIRAGHRSSDLSTSASSRHARDTSGARPWWHVGRVMDGSVMSNLAENLASRGELIELADILTDAKWALAQLETGNLPSWITTFAQLFAAMDVGPGDDSLRDRKTRMELGSVRDAVREAWGNVVGNKDNFAFQMHARLIGVSVGSWPVERFLRSVSETAKQPWLRPMSRCWPRPGSCLLEIPLNTRVNFMDAAEKNWVGAIGEKVVALDLETGLSIWEWNEKPGGEVDAVVVSADGKVAMSGWDDNLIYIHDGATGQTRHGPLQGRNRDYDYMKLALSGDGRYAVALHLRNVELEVWDCESAELVCTLTQDTFATRDDAEERVRWRCVGVSADGRVGASGSESARVWVWNCEVLGWVRGPFCGHTDEVTCVALSATGDRVASGSRDETVRVWDVASGVLVCAPLRGHTQSVSDVTMSVDGRLIVSGSQDWTVRVWDAETGQPVGLVLHGHNATVQRVALSEDERRVVSGSDDGIVRVWDQASNAALSGTNDLGDIPKAMCLCRSLDGLSIVSGGRDGKLQIWDVDSAQAVAESVRGHASVVTCVAVSADRHRLASGSKDNSVRVWDGQTAQPIGEPLRAHFHHVGEVAFSLDGEHVVSRGKDLMLKLWAVDTGRSVGPTQRVGPEARNLRVTDDTVSVTIGQSIRRWTLDKQKGLVPLLDSALDIRAMSETGGNAPHDRSSGDPMRIRCEGKVVWACEGEAEYQLAILPSFIAEWCFYGGRRRLVVRLQNCSLLWFDVVLPEGAEQS